MQHLEFSKWEIRDLTACYHELRNERQQLVGKGVSRIIMNRTERLFDKLRFAEFAERQGDGR